MERLHAADLRPRSSVSQMSLASLLCDPPPRLVIPEELTADLGYDAVGTPKEHGERIMNALPLTGCVFADDRRWWWIVPAGSHIGVTWPPCTDYAVDAYLADPSWTRGHRPGGPALLHRPDGDSPYTPPIPLYFMTCRLAGITPHWSLETGHGAASG